MEVQILWHGLQRFSSNAVNRACCEQEAPEPYNLRLKIAFDPIPEQAWRWPGGVLVKEQHADQEQIHMIDQYCWLGSAQNEDELYDLIEHSSSEHQNELGV